MQKKIKEENATEVQSESPIVSFFKGLKDTLVNNLMTNIKENIQERIIRVEKKIFRNITSYCFFILGIVFLSLAAVFLANYYLKLNFGWAFLIIAGLSLLLALFFRWLAKTV